MLKLIKYLSFILYFFFLILGYINNIGNDILWVTFSFLSLVIFGYLWNPLIGPAFKFFCIFCLLGLSVKTVLFLFYGVSIFGTSVIDYSINESIMDKILITICFSFLSIIVAQIFYKKIGLFFDLNSTVKKNNIPNFYQANRIFLQVFLFLSIVFVNLINYYFGIHRIGLLYSETYFWPTNAIISTMLNLGLTFLICLIVWWDRLLGFKNIFQIFLFSFEALITSITVMSRSILIFHQIPNFVLILNNKRNYILKSFFIVFTSILIGIGLVSYNRAINYNYDAQNDESRFINKFIDANENIFSILIIKRWIGLEGVINSTVSNELRELNKTANLSSLFSHTFESTYAEISGSIYLDKTNYNFRDLPGIVGFLSFSNNILFLIIGLFIVISFIIIFEYIFNRFIENQLLKYFFGINLSYTLYMFGFDFYGAFIFVSLIISMSLVAFILQSNLYCKKHQPNK